MIKVGDRFVSAEREETVVVMTPLVKDMPTMHGKGKEYVHYIVLPSGGEQYICEIEEFKRLFTKIEKPSVCFNSNPNGYLIYALKDGCNEEAVELSIYGPYETFEEARDDCNAYTSQPEIAEDYYITETFIKPFTIQDERKFDDYHSVVVSYVKNQYPMCICGNPSVIGVFENREDALAMLSCIGNKRTELEDGVCVTEVIDIKKIEIIK